MTAAPVAGAAAGYRLGWPAVGGPPKEKVDMEKDEMVFFRFKSQLTELPLSIDSLSSPASVYIYMPSTCAYVLGASLGRSTWKAYSQMGFKLASAGSTIR